jgi:hypothetical protein
LGELELQGPGFWAANLPRSHLGKAVKCGTDGKCIKKKVCLSVKGGFMLVLAMAVGIDVASTNVLHDDSALLLYLGRMNSSQNSNEQLRVRNLHMWRGSIL